MPLGRRRLEPSPTLGTQDSSDSLRGTAKIKARLKARTTLAAQVEGIDVSPQRQPYSANIPSGLGNGELSSENEAASTWGWRRRGRSDTASSALTAVSSSSSIPTISITESSDHVPLDREVDYPLQSTDQGLSERTLAAAPDAAEYADEAEMATASDAEEFLPGTSSNFQSGSRFGQPTNPFLRASASSVSLSTGTLPSRATTTQHLTGATSASMSPETSTSASVPANAASRDPRQISQGRPFRHLNHRRQSRECASSLYNEPVLHPPLNNRPSSSSSAASADRHLHGSTPSKSQTMALKFLSAHTPHSSGSSSSVKHFDIRLDNDYIIFRGNEDEASSAQLAGSLVLCLTEAMNIHHVDLTLSGIVHMSWQSTSTSSMSGKRTSYKEKTFFEKNWTFRDPGKGKSEILPPDNYEWPFSTILEGVLPESVEGLKDAWIIYRLKAEISRKRGRDIVIRKPLRVVRTLDPSALELSHAMSVENVWPNKIEYSISIPNKAVAFGSFVQVDFKLISLLKGLVIGNVSTQVKEEQEFVVDPEWGVSALNNGVTKSDRVIVTDIYKVDAEQVEQVIDEVVEGYQFSRYLELPKSLNHCLQDCNVKGLKVRHKVKFNVQLHNPDGHISELRANLPVSFYISPSLPINENNDLVDQSPQAGRAAIANDIANAAPPVYGQHTLDALYSDVSGYGTPGTALSTPGTPYLHSRHASSDNLASLDAVANGNSVSPAALQTRLQNLRVGDSVIQDLRGNEDSEIQSLGLRPEDDSSRRGSVLAAGQDDYFQPHDLSNGSPHPHISPNDVGASSDLPSHVSSAPGSTLMSRRASEEEDGQHSGTRTPFPQTHHMEDLARVPSYTTAVKTPLPRQPNDLSSSLPTYGAAITEPRGPALAEPPIAHLRTSPRLPGRITVSSQSPDSPINGAPRGSLSHRSVNSIQDEERRLRTMQMRGR